MRNVNKRFTNVMSKSFSKNNKESKNDKHLYFVNKSKQNKNAMRKKNESVSKLREKQQSKEESKKNSID